MKLRHREALHLGLGLLVAALVFEGWPGLDVAVSGWFEHGPGRFPANDWTAVQWVYQGVPWLGRALFIGSLGVLLLAGLRRERVARHQWRRCAALALVLALGLGALVHGVFKEHWGRPRPDETTAFAGTLPFQPALHPSSLCATNCSFVSGHAATGFVLMAWGLFGSPATRRRWAWTGLVAGLLIGAVRVAQGRHFASDIVFGALFIALCGVLLREAWLRVMCWRRQRQRRAAARQRWPVLT